MTFTVIDTDILIDAARRVPAAIDTLTALEADGILTISLITQLELMVGCRNKTELRKTERFLERFAVIPVDEASGVLAIDLIRRYRLSHGLLIPDSLIAASAMSRDLPLATKNQSDYRFIEGLRLTSYPVLPASQITT